MHLDVSVVAFVAASVHGRDHFVQRVEGALLELGRKVLPVADRSAAVLRSLLLLLVHHRWSIIGTAVRR